MDKVNSHFLLAYTAFVVSLVSPGPDFALVLKNSLRFGKKASLPTALGIATGNWAHILLALLGLTVALLQFPQMALYLKWAGSAYLLYLSAGCFRSNGIFFDQKGHLENKLEAGGASFLFFFRQGVFTNVLNPKAALFFLSFFSSLSSQHWSIQSKWILAACISVTALFWFYFVGSMLDKHLAHRLNPLLQSRISKGLGILFLVFAFMLIFF